MGDAVEVTLQIGIDHPVVSALRAASTSHHASSRHVPAESRSSRAGTPTRRWARVPVSAPFADRSLTVGMPSGRLPPPGLGMGVRRTALGRWRPACSSASSSSKYLSAWAAKRSMLTPSTPAAPVARHAFPGRCKRPTVTDFVPQTVPFTSLTPSTRAANIRSVHTDGSTQVHWRGSRVLHACLAVSGTDALGISPPSVLVFTDQTFLPTFGSARLCSPRFSSAPDRPSAGVAPQAS